MTIKSKTITLGELKRLAEKNNLSDDTPILIIDDDTEFLSGIYPYIVITTEYPDYPRDTNEDDNEISNYQERAIILSMYDIGVDQ